MAWVIGLLALLVLIVSVAALYGLALLERIDSRLHDIQVGIKLLRDGQ